MSGRVLHAALGLFALLASEAAFAQKVLLLEFTGDKRGRIRTQLVRELQRGNEVELVPIKDHVRLAGKRGFKGDRAMTPPAVARTSRSLGYVVAVEGAVGKDFFVRFLDASGNELWSREIPIKRGELSAKNVGRLGKAIVAAAKSAAPAAAPEAEEEEAAEEEAPREEPPAEVTVESDTPTVTSEEESSSTEEAQQLPGLDVSGQEETREERERRLAEEQAESHTATGAEAAAREELRDEDLDREGRSRRAGKPIIGPKLVTVTVAGTTTWRAYCSRPGVSSCREYDALAVEERPAGDTVDFSPQVPYSGFLLELEFFPLASFDNPLNGLGLSAEFSRGFSLTNVRVQTPSGEAPEKRVISIDDAWHAFGHYRYHFGLGGGKAPNVGWVGLMGGIDARTFEVDPSAQVPLPGSHRRYPAAGAELSVPLASFIRIEAAGMYFFNPMAGPDEIVGYGSDATGRGFRGEAGVAGTLWGPLGYTLKFRLTSYTDAFTGQGNKWANGGAAEETYTALHWGATAAF